MSIFDSYNNTEMMIATRAAETMDDGSMGSAAFLGRCYFELERRGILEEYVELKFSLA